MFTGIGLLPEVSITPVNRAVFNLSDVLIFLREIKSMPSTCQATFVVLYAVRLVITDLVGFAFELSPVAIVYMTVGVCSWKPC